MDYDQYGIPPMILSDGPHGIRRQAGTGDHLGIHASLKATCFPTAATIANSWNEQAIREIYLKPFEYFVKHGEASAMMCSYAFVGNKWGGSNSSLLKTILREERSFTGFVSY